MFSQRFGGNFKLKQTSQPCATWAPGCLGSVAAKLQRHGRVISGIEGSENMKTMELTLRVRM